MSNQRISIGVLIAIIILGSLYLEYITFLYVALNFAVVYDTIYLIYKFQLNRIFVLIFFLSMIAFNKYLLIIYPTNPLFVLKIGFVSQVSDIYQYIAGSCWGKYKIGWISKNKSYEGYIGGYLFTMITFVPIFVLIDYYQKKDQSTYFTDVLLYWLNDCTLIYFLGVVGGLISSLAKRMADIKDYSNLLGAHGGWVDRIDSIILPLLLMPYNY